MPKQNPIVKTFRTHSNLRPEEVLPRKEVQRYSDFLKEYNSLKMTDSDLEKLKTLDAEFNEVYSLRELDRNRIVLNLQEEMEKFFSHLEKGKIYNPVFEHNPHPYDENGMLKRAESLKKKFQTFECFLSPYYIDRLNFLLKYGKAMTLDRDSSEYAALIKDIFAPPEPDLVKRAKALIQKNPYVKVPSSERPIDSKEMKKRIDQALRDLGYDKWKVKVVDTITPRMNVKDEYIVNVNKDANFSEEDVKGLIQHEIKGHVGRRWYGDKIGLILFRNGLMGKNIFDEGLAIYNSLHKVETPKPNILFNICFYAIMCGQLENLDFYSLFQFGKQYMPNSDKKLFLKIARMKRVCHDTSVLIGDFYEAEYLSGYLKVSEMNDRERDEIRKFNIGPSIYQQLDVIKSFLRVNGFIGPDF